MQFKPEKNYCNPEAKAEAIKLQNNSINLQETKWDKETEGMVRISAMNVRSLPQHQEDLQEDKFIMGSDIIDVQETWLQEEPVSLLPTFPHQYFVHGHSKGMAIFTRIKPRMVKRIQTDCCSVIMADFEYFEIINVYRFCNTNVLQFTEEIRQMLDPNKTQVLVGDINLDLLKQPDNPFSEEMARFTFRQIVTTPTHLQVHIFFHNNRNFIVSLISITCKYIL